MKYCCADFEWAVDRAFIVNQPDNVWEIRFHDLGNPDCEDISYCPFCGAKLDK